MAIERSTVVGVFRDRDKAERAVEELHRLGFRDDQIGFMMRGAEGTTVEATDDNGNRAGEAATGGIVTGGLIGGALAAASLLIPGVGPVLAGGILATIIGGAAAGGAVGGLLGMLVGSGIPDDEAHYYESEFNEGRILVTVKAGNRYQEARDALMRLGAYDIESGRGTTTGTVTTGTAPVGTARRDLTDRDTVRLHEERLQPEKETVKAGEVTVGKDVVTEHHEIEVPVRHEEVHIERRPIEGRPTTGEIREGEQIRVPVHEERVDVNKQTVAYEEVEVGKRQVHDTERVGGEVRREEAVIERHGDVDVHGTGAGIRSWSDMSPEYRQRWQTRYGALGGRFEDYEPYYRYGYEMSMDPRYQNREWRDVESDLHRDYGTWARTHGYHDDNAWERFKDAVQDSWDTVRGRRRAA